MRRRRPIPTGLSLDSQDGQRLQWLRRYQQPSNVTHPNHHYDKISKMNVIIVNYDETIDWPQMENRSS
jgi:hypothetical protein